MNLFKCFFKSTDPIGEIERIIISTRQYVDNRTNFNLCLSEIDKAIRIYERNKLTQKWLIATLYWLKAKIYFYRSKNQPIQTTPEEDYNSSIKFYSESNSIMNQLISHPGENRFIPTDLKQISNSISDDDLVFFYKLNHIEIVLDHALLFLEISIFIESNKLFEIIQNEFVVFQPEQTEIGLLKQFYWTLKARFYYRYSLHYSKTFNSKKRKECLHNCIESIEKTKIDEDGSKSIYCSSLTSLGHIYFHSSDFDRAEQYYQLSMDNEINEYRKAQEKNNIASCLIEKKDYSKAINLLIDAESVILNSKSIDQTLISIYLHLAIANMEKGDLKKSEEYFEKSRLQMINFGIQKPAWDYYYFKLLNKQKKLLRTLIFQELAHLLNYKRKIYIEIAINFKFQKDFKESESFFKRAIDDEVDKICPSLYDKIIAYSEYIKFLIERGRFKETNNLFKAMLDTILILNIQVYRYNNREIKEIHKVLISLFEELLKSKEIELQLYTIEVLKNSFLLRSNFVYSLLDDNGRDLLLEVQYKIIERKILLEKNPSNEEEQRIIDVTSFLNEENIIKDHLNSNVSISFDIKSIQSKLGDSECILNYYVFGNDIHLYLITKTTIQKISLAVSPNWKVKLANYLDLIKISPNDLRNYRIYYCIEQDGRFSFFKERNEAVGRVVNPLNNRTDLLKGLSCELYKLLIEPALKDLKKFSTIKIIPDKELFTLPFGTLFDGSQYLVEKFCLVHLFNMSTFRENNNGAPQHPFLGIGGSLVYNPPIPNLPFSEIEIEKSNKEYYGSIVPTHLILNNDVSIHNLLSRREDLKNHKIVHFSLHGKSGDEFPENSCLELASDDQLTFSKCIELGLNIDLVVLSACETALGKDIGEGYINLPTAFLVSGCKSVIASLWCIDDQMTSEIMVEFHRQLNANRINGISKFLQETIKHFIMHDPYYWGAFNYYE